MNVARLKAFIVYRHKATMELSLRLLALHLGLFFVSCTNVTENISAEVDLMLSYFYYYSYFYFYTGKQQSHCHALRWKPRLML